MSRIKTGLIFIILIFSISARAGTVILKGTAPEWTGTQLEFITYSDQISYTEKVLCSTVVDNTGNFKCSFETHETVYVFIYLGTYEAYFFAEPDSDYTLILPEKTEKSISDKLNPYFKTVLYHLGIENSSQTELNYLLAWFDTEFSNMINSNAYLIYTKSSELNVDAAISSVDSIFKNFNNPYFVDYKNYSYAAFRHLSFQQKSKSISNSYYLNYKILYQNKAYMDLFNQVYDKYFSYFGRTEKGKQIYSDIGLHKSITLLKKTLGQDSILTNDTLKELVILKCLHDEFYDDMISRSATLTVLDSLALQTTNEEHKQIANNIRQKVTRLMVGFEPPPFTLFDKDSNLVTLEKYRGKYVYLGFCASISYACIQEFEMLRKLHEKHAANFEIIVICMDESLAQMKTFVEKMNYPYTFLFYGNQADVFKEYDIRALPTYYFINKEGKLALSPAASPGENIEYYIFQVMRANKDI
ncbi:MAG: hypothetical protein A2X13_08840 [Bacteroidetes bacterium GWC2_33_15]|nr:MAG: hypothetical protein A2X10_14735 [Bacteroidetes bacterium GWA2_33_15]OFX51357.1 MAG: hypothetical protein A2X13_08840 [Bacteroidetes bacterium GWC2_33_15]OFX63141.1 MAG: hypothetical protein A2X15_14070 [Bacteroidetes bacterium GWB2_32_14]OFX70733.1 MAG: hypothetical protein A2X14_11215 [Bacteroidetes bacterium GWD2_33_33]HAN18468.1 hypothetical protein [Bacteroidales bacterium]